MIKSLHLRERPRERCLEHGPECLSLREILAVLIGTGPRNKGCLGLSNDVLERVSSSQNEEEQEHALFGSIRSGSILSAGDIKGLQAAGRARLLACFDLAKRYSNYCFSSLQENPKNLALSDIRRAASAKIDSSFRKASKERLAFVPLLSSGKWGELVMIERGVRSHVNFDVRELFSKVLALRPMGFVLTHNHPSGNVKPSADDIHLTERVYEIAHSLNTPLLGHLIVSALNEHWLRFEEASAA